MSRTRIVIKLASGWTLCFDPPPDGPRATLLTALRTPDDLQIMDASLYRPGQVVSVYLPQETIADFKLLLPTADPPPSPGKGIEYRG